MEGQDKGRVNWDFVLNSTVKLEACQVKTK